MLDLNRHLEKLNKTFSLVAVVRLDHWKSLDFSNQTWKKIVDVLTSIRQDEFQTKERIVIVTNGRQFNNSLSYRNFLQKLQSLINTVDITNFFIVLLHNDAENQDLIAQDCNKVSSDPTSMTFEYYLDDSKLYQQHKVKNLLEDSKVFCILPWTHLMISPYNEIRPCCLANEKVGDVTKHSLETAWNSEEMKRLRLSMINEAFHPACVKCYELEKVGGSTARKMYNSSELAEFFPLVNDTNPDGSLDDFKLRYIDLRFSNLCNLRCRTCNHHSSSKWYEDEKKLNPNYNKPFIIKAGRHKLDVWEQILPHIDSIEKIYFAGGEPLLMDEHYWLLEELEKRKKFDVNLFYNTNFTAVKQKQRHLFDYWKNFTKIGIGASLDASGARAEYLRKDTQWNKIVDNILLLRQELPHINFKISCTVSIFNSLHVCDFHKESVEQGLIAIDEFKTNLVLEPEYQRLDIAPPRFKEKIKNKYINHISWLNANGADQQTIDEYYKLIKFINENDNTNYLDAFKKSTQQVDDIRNESILNVFPELNELFNET